MDSIYTHASFIYIETYDMHVVDAMHDELVRKTIIYMEFVPCFMKLYKNVQYA